MVRLSLGSRIEGHTDLVETFPQHGKRPAGRAPRIASVMSRGWIAIEYSASSSCQPIHSAHWRSELLQEMKKSFVRCPYDSALFASVSPSAATTSATRRRNVAGSRVPGSRSSWAATRVKRPVETVMLKNRPITP